MNREKEFTDACYKGDCNSAIELINNGIAYYFLNDGLYYACVGGHKKLVLLLIKKGSNNWSWGLYGACRGGHKELVELMISYGANHWDLGLNGACSEGKKEMAELMISYGATDWNWGLQGACHGGNKKLTNLSNSWKQELDYGEYKELILLMIEKGANIDECFLTIGSNDILYLIQKKVKNYGKYQELTNKLIKLRTQLKILLDSFLIRDLVGIILCY